MYPEMIGGGALHAHELSRLQAEQGHDVTILTSDHGDDTKPRYEERSGYEVRRYRQIARPFNNSITPGLVPALWRLAKGYDVIHAHSHLYFSTNVAAVISRLRSTPLVITNHGLLSQSAPIPVQKAYVPVARLTFDAANRVLCYTETDQARLRDIGVSAPISVIHNGIDCDTFNPEACDRERLQVLFVGRLKRTKGVHKLLEAFNAIANDIPDLTLKIVGDGPLRLELESRVLDLDLTDRVTFTGRLPNDELPQVYAESAVFALPSTVEGFPRTILEALACGTPVVTSDLPQLETVVETVGKTVPPDNTEALADALNRMLTEDERRQELGTRGRELVREQFSWADTVAQTTQVYYELLE